MAGGRLGMDGVEVARQDEVDLTKETTVAARTAYLDLDDASQVEVLRPAAYAAADRFGLEVARMELAAHAYNTTFAVDSTDGRRWALRLGVNSHSTPPHLVAQQEWLRAIAAETTVGVPEPLRTTDGEWYAEVDAPGFGRPVLVTAASWLAGIDVGECDAETAYALGATMAALHAHAGRWRLPPGGELPTRTTQMFGDDDLMDDAPGVTDLHREILDRSRAAAAEAYARVHDDHAPLRVIHADLHGGNLKWLDGQLSVFDVDDCGLGLPVVDLAVSTFYLRGGDPALEAALRSGYVGVAPWPEVDPTWFEAIVADRQLLLLNSLLTSSTAELRRSGAAYLDVAIERLRGWLETGTFTRALG